MPPDLDAPLLRTFLVCVRAGSLSRAATILGRTQPAVSQQLRRLEDIVGCPLLYRTPTGVSPTQRGERMIPYAERILSLSAEAVQIVGRGHALEGRCTIGLLEDLATPSLARALEEFAARHPAAVLEIAILSGPAVAEAVATGRIQLYLGDAACLDQPPVRTVRLPLVWAAAPGFDPTADPLPLALFSPPCRWRDPVRQVLHAAGRASRIAFESTGLAGILAGMQAGLGVGALLPATVGPGLAVLGPDSGLPPLPPVEIGLVRRPGTEGDMLVDAVAALLAGLI